MKSLQRASMTARRRTGQAGFTLIELAIATVLFSVILLTAGGMILAVAGGNAYGSTRTTGAFHMQQQVERFREMPYTSLANGTADTVFANGARIRAEWQVSELVPGRLAQVDLRVLRIPTGPGGQERAVRLFIANRDPQ